MCQLYLNKTGNIFLMQKQNHSKQCENTNKKLGESICNNTPLL